MNACRSVCGPTGLGDPGAARDAANNPPGAMPVQPTAISGQEDRPFHALADGQIYRPGGARRERDRDNLAALAGDDQGPVRAKHSMSARRAWNRRT